MIKEFSTIGELKDLYGGSVSVDAMEFTNAASGEKTRGIRIEVKQTSRLERDHSSFIDYEEIASLVNGLDYIGTIDKTSIKLDDFEATYDTKGDFKITVFSQGKEKKLAVSSGQIGGTLAYFKIGDLSKLQGLLTDAVKKLDSIKSGGNDAPDTVNKEKTP